jgi:hypothetical protein
VGEGKIVGQESRIGSFHEARSYDIRPARLNLAE